VTGTFNGGDPEAALAQVLGTIFSGKAPGVKTGELPAFFPGPVPPLKPGPVLILPPDLTRIHSRAGTLTGTVCRELEKHSSETAGIRDRWSLGAIVPALGTHRPLNPEEIARMFPRCPAEMFLPHQWRDDTVELGRLRADWVAAVFSGQSPGDSPRAKEGALVFGGHTPTDHSGTQGGGRAKSPVDRAYYMDWPVQVNRLLRDGLPPGNGKARGPKGGEPFSLIISIGQVVPHEVAGMANHAKNIFVGTGGAEAINKSHWLGALYGLERIMGERENPVRSLFDEALRRFGGLLPPVLWVLTVVDQTGTFRGLFTGFGRECFEQASNLAARVNITRLDEPARKIVVWLDPGEYRSTWLGNKALYRTRKAIASGGELVILAPALDRFGEDGEIDGLIRRYGYQGRAAILRALGAEHSAKETPGRLGGSLCAAAHLIHGSTEGRFTVRYCPGKAPEKTGGPVERRDIESVGYEWGNLTEEAARYLPEGPEKLAAGWNSSSRGERFYFIRNPGLGLWTV
jgi:hypothetical protein